MKRFRSVDNQPKRIAQLSGHVAWVMGDWTELHERFHQDAYAAGCISEDMIKNSALDELDEAALDRVVKDNDLRAKIRGIFKRWIEENDLEKFAKKDNKYLLSALNKEIGFNVQRHMADTVWYELQEEIEP